MNFFLIFYISLYLNPESFRHDYQSLKACGALVHRPVGGFYLFPDFSTLRTELASCGITSSRKLCEQLLEHTGVAALPGSEFGRPEEELSLRLAYVDFDGAKALVACDTEYADKELDKNFIEAYCPNVASAMKAISDWIQQCCQSAED